MSTNRSSIPALPVRLAVLLLALVLVTFALIPSTSASVGSGCKYVQGMTTYYSDSTYTTIVSFYSSGCNGGCNGSGPITKWWRFNSYSCAD